MKLSIKHLDPKAITPKYATDGSGCFDLFALDEGRPHPRDPHAAIFRTGIAFAVPSGWVMEVYSRSGQGFKEATRLRNCVGIIDSDYRGEVMVALRYDGDNDMRCPKVRVGDRIAQAKLALAPRVTFQAVDELGATDRGTGGFGSTGK